MSELLNNTSLWDNRIYPILQKLGELKILAEKFSFPEDARKILVWANIRLRQGDESFLDNKLEQLRMLDRQGWMPIKKIHRPLSRIHIAERP